MYSKEVQEWIDTYGEYVSESNEFTQEHVNNLLNHAVFIENIESRTNGKKFDMGLFYGIPADPDSYSDASIDGVPYKVENTINFDKDCDSAMCAIGWATHNSDLPDLDDDAGWWSYSRRIFGISSSGTSIGSVCFSPLLSIDPKLVSGRMRDVAKYMQDKVNNS